ncbi:MAG: potassium transporter TrkG, partial [Desulfovibrionaceae bacterium]|nr:potassium transporter TrkG [Desulfovibrionaceae bacterium]
MSAARQELAGKYRAVSAYTGLVLLICGLLMLLPLAGLIEEPREAADVWGFLAPALVLAGLGLGLWRGLGPGDAALTVREGRVVVLFGWLGVCLVSAWPFMAVMNLPLHLAVFESVSGWSTTGLSILDVEAAPRTILLWRSVTQFAGGAGLAVIMLASIAGPAGSGLTEAAGRSEQLVPNVRSSARTVLGIYLAYALAATASYRVLGMDLFDAVNHAMATVSTGGFSTRAASIGYWNSMGLEAAVMVFMLLGSLNFLT